MDTLIPQSVSVLCQPRQNSDERKDVDGINRKCFSLGITQQLLQSERRDMKVVETERRGVWRREHETKKWDEDR